MIDDNSSFGKEMMNMLAYKTDDNWYVKRLP